MYTVGKLYRWVGQRGRFAWLNGSECTVTGPMEMHSHSTKGIAVPMWPTDTPSRDPGFSCVGAEAGDLVPVDPPSGERSVLELFRAPELEPA